MYNACHLHEDLVDQTSDGVGRRTVEGAAIRDPASPLSFVPRNYKELEAIFRNLTNAKGGMMAATDIELMEVFEGVTQEGHRKLNDLVPGIQEWVSVFTEECISEASLSTYTTR